MNQEVLRPGEPRPISFFFGEEPELLTGGDSIASVVAVTATLLEQSTSPDTLPTVGATSVSVDKRSCTAMVTAGTAEDNTYLMKAQVQLTLNPQSKPVRQGKILVSSTADIQ